MRRRTVITGIGVVALGAAAAVTLAFGSAPDGTAKAAALPPATAKVTRTTLVETKTVAGTLGYGEPVPVGVTGGGTLTWLAPEGDTVRRGEPLYKVDQRPVVVLYGKLPLYRTLRAGVDGDDVEQLEENLAALGYTGFTVDDAYTDGTAAAVTSWQEDLGLTETGTVEPGQVVITPSAVRIGERTARVGDRVGGGQVLAYTGTTRLVTVDLEVADQSLAVKGRKVSVHIPGGTTVEGKIARVGTVAEASEDSGDTPQGTGSTTSEATIEVTVEIAEQRKLGSLAAAPVDVDFVSGERTDVLAVPVAALLALAEGGYGVQLVDGATTRIVAVETGMFADGKVEISGTGIDEGATVGVPS